MNALKRCLGLLALMVVWVVAGSPVYSQSISYPPFNIMDNPEYLNAKKLARLGRSEEALAILKNLAATNPHTTLGAVSLFRAASISNLENDKIAIYNSIITQYPGSRFEIEARMSLVNMQTATFPRNNQGRLVQYDQLLRSFGGPTLANILQGGMGPTTRAASLPVEIQKGINEVYVEMGGVLSNALNRQKDALAVAMFRRMAFNFDNDAMNDIRFLLVNMKYGSWFAHRGLGPRNPEVHMDSSQHFQAKGPRPRFQWDTVVGNWLYSQVDISKVQVLLDGQDLHTLLRVRSYVNSSMSTKPDAIFERLSFSLRPAQPLSRGRHTLVITVPVLGYTGGPGGPGITTVQRDFFVNKSDDDHDDEHDDTDAGGVDCEPLRR